MKIDVNKLKRGDILLVHNKNRQHTAIYCGNKKIVSARINEKGTITGGQPGDQTGHEIEISNFVSSYPWECVLRYKDETIADGAALFAETIAKDDAHGYDQNNRNGQPDFDCSSLVLMSYKAVHVDTKGATYTGNMKSNLKKAGFYEVSFEEETPATENTYIVKKGDTLTSIAKLCGSSVAELVKINGISDPDLITVGQVLYLPNKVVIKEPETIKGTVTTKKLPLNIRKEPNTKSPVIGQLAKGSKIELDSISNCWGKLSKRNGFVSMDFVKLD